MSSNADKVEELITWARNGGAYLHERVEVYEDEQYGIALKVRGSSAIRALETETGHLPAKSRVVSCPFTLSLSWLNALDIYTALESHSTRLPLEILATASAHVIGNFFLMQQYLMGHNSHWHKYIQSLPQPDEHEKLGTPLYFTAADLKWIQGTNLELARNQREQTWKLEWSQGASILNNYESLADLKGKWSLDLYRWAATIFSSRSFVSNLIPKEVLELSTSRKAGDIEPTNLFQSDAPSQRANFFKEPFPVLFPLVDLANHSSAAKVTWFSNAHESHNKLRDLSIIIDSDIPQGYGFCLPDNDEVEMSFLPLDDDRTKLRKTNKTLFSVRKKPYYRDERLVEFRMFEDGFVDTMALCVANQRELSFFKDSPEYRLETSDENVFTAAPLARNSLHAISALYERLNVSLARILLPGEHLGIPANPSQRAAKMYREGQISTIRSALRPLEERLQAAMSMLVPNAKSNRYADMQDGVYLCKLQEAFDWLADQYPQIWDVAKSALCVELEAEDVHELISSDWEFVCWCVVAYITAALHFFGEAKASTDQITIWMKNMVQIYADTLVPDFESWPFQMFQGELDEFGSLEAIIARMDLLNGTDLNANSIREGGGADAVNQRLMAFSSTIVKEESLPVAVEISYVDGCAYHASHTALCLLKNEHTKRNTFGAATMVEKGKWVKGATPEAIKEILIISGMNASHSDYEDSPWPPPLKEESPDSNRTIPPHSPFRSELGTVPNTQSDQGSAILAVEEYLRQTDDETSKNGLLALSSPRSRSARSTQDSPLTTRGTSCLETASLESTTEEEDYLFCTGSLGSFVTSVEGDEEFQMRGRRKGSKSHAGVVKSVTSYPGNQEQENTSNRETSPLKRQMVGEDPDDGYEQDSLGSPPKRAKSNSVGTSFVIQHDRHDFLPKYAECENLPSAKLGPSAQKSELQSPSNTYE